MPIKRGLASGRGRGPRSTEELRAALVAQGRPEYGCAREGCIEAATHLVLESHPLAMVFKDGAGLMMCREHARQMFQLGGLPITFAELRKCEIDLTLLVSA